MADDGSPETINWRLVFNHYLATGTPDQLYRDDFVALRNCGAFSPALKQREFDDILKDAWNKVPESCLKKTEHGRDWILPRDAQLGEGADANYILEEVLKELCHVTVDWLKQAENLKTGDGSEHTGHGFKGDEEDRKQGQAKSSGRRLSSLGDKLGKANEIASGDYKAAEEKIASLRREKVELEAKVETTKANYNALLKAHEGLKSKFEASESWSAESQELEMKIAGLEKDLKDSKANCDKITQSARSKIGDLHRAANAEKEKCQKEKEALEAKLSAAKEQHTTAIQASTKKTAELERACQVSKSQMEKAKEALQAASSSHRNTKLLLESIAKGSANERESKLWEEIKHLREQLKTKERGLKHATKICEDGAEKAESTLGSEMDDLRAANMDLAAEVEKLETGIRTFDQNAALMEERETKLVEELSGNTAKIDSLQDEVKRLQNENSVLESRIGKVTKEAKANIGQLETTIKALTSSKKKVELENQALKDDSGTKRKVDQQQTQDEQRKQAIERFMEKKAAKELTTKLETTDTANADLEVQVNTLQKKYQDLLRENQESKQTKTDLERRIARRNATIQKLQSQIEDLKLKVESCQQASSTSVFNNNDNVTVERLQTEVKNAKSEIQQLKSNLETQVQRVGRRDATIEQLKEKIQEMDEQSSAVEEAWKKAEKRADASESKLEMAIKLNESLEAELVQRMAKGESSLSADNDGGKSMANNKNTAGASGGRRRGGSEPTTSSGLSGSSSVNELKAMKKAVYAHSHAYAKDGSPLLERVGKASANGEDDEDSDEEDDDGSVEESEDGE